MYNIVSKVLRMLYNHVENFRNKNQFYPQSSIS